MARVRNITNWPSLCALLSFGLIACAPQPQFKGREFAYGLAPDFRLPDQNGEIIALSELRGKVVVLSFLYTNCRDVCPVTANKFSTAYDQLGDAAKGVVFIAISSDPENDTLLAVRRFTQAHRLDGKWHYLIGTRPQLEAVWKAYFVPATKIEQTQEVIHSQSVLLIDKRGAFRLKHDGDFEPDDLAHDVLALSKE